MSLVSLPLEMVWHIISCLSVRDTISFMCCSRWFRQTVIRNPGLSVQRLLGTFFQCPDAILRLLLCEGAELSSSLLNRFVRPLPTVRCYDRPVIYPPLTLPRPTTFKLFVPVPRSAPALSKLLVCLDDTFRQEDMQPVLPRPPVRLPRYRLGHIPPQVNWKFTDTCRKITVVFVHSYGCWGQRPLDYVDHQLFLHCNSGKGTLFFYPGTRLELLEADRGRFNSSCSSVVRLRDAPHIVFSAKDGSFIDPSPAEFLGSPLRLHRRPPRLLRTNATLGSTTLAIR